MLQQLLSYLYNGCTAVILSAGAHELAGGTTSLNICSYKLNLASNRRPLNFWPFRHLVITVVFWMLSL
ncbi:putative potassium transport system protein Kup [Dirofilaria immitis]